MMIDSSAKGSVSGSESRIVTGWSHDSNCAARIKYMNTSERYEGNQEVLSGTAQLARAAREARAVPGPMFSASAERCIASIAGVCEKPCCSPAKTVTCR